MEDRRQGDLIVIRMYSGEDFIPSLLEVCERHAVRAAVVLSSIGQLEDFELGYFVKKGDYHPTRFDEPYELIAVSGIISRENGAYAPHLHACLGGKEKQAVAGHLVRGKVKITNETVLQAFDMDLGRVENPKTGLMDLKAA